MKITVYTVSDCQFSKQEKEYLQSHNLAFEEKNLEQNREWLTEMLAVSNNFAGTPVTKIEKDDGTIVVLKGFTHEEFDEVLGFKKESTQPPSQIDASQTPPPPPPQPPVDQSQTPTPQQSESPVSSQTPPTSTDNPIPPKPDDSLNSILADLEAKVNQTSNEQLKPPQSPNQPSSPPSSLPNIPDFNDQS